MAGEHPRDTALAEPSGAGAGAKARCPQTGDCVANVSARPCAIEPAKLCMTTKICGYCASYRAGLFHRELAICIQIPFA